MKLLFSSLLLFFGISCYSQQHYLIMGTFTSGEYHGLTANAGQSHGIYIYRFNSQTADAILVDSIKSSNPAYLAIHKNLVYAGNEDTPGYVSAYRLDTATGKLQLLNEVPISGNEPCYITISKNGKWVITGNYSSGSISVFSTNEDGSLQKLEQTIQHTGTGPNTKRQEKPHVHAAVFSPDEKFLLTPDLGTDKVMIYRFDQQKGILTPQTPSFVQTSGGSGPRHLEFHPYKKWAYLIQELNGKILTITYDGKGKFSSLPEVNAQEKDYAGPISGADIHVSRNGKFLYSSNRGTSNTIAVFSINQQTGAPTLIQHHSTMGKIPRNFNFDPSGKYILVGNLESNQVSILNVNNKTGLLSDSGKRIDVPNPVCVKWISTK